MPNFRKFETIDFPTSYGEFVLSLYETNYPTQPNMKYVLVISKKEISENPTIRIHSSCLFGDTFGSLYCDCREQLTRGLKEIEAQNGILFYLEQEGRSHGIFNKTKEMMLQQNENLDTVEASLRLGIKPDERDYTVVSDILKSMDITQVKLMTNNPDKIKSLKDNGVDVERVSIEVEPSKHNLSYQRTKKNKFNHILDKFLD